MEVEEITLHDFLLRNKNEKKAGTNSGGFLLSLAIQFNNASVSFLKNVSVQDYELQNLKEMPSGLEGCFEFMEKHAKEFILHLHFEDGDIVGCEMKFNGRFC